MADTLLLSAIENGLAAARESMFAHMATSPDMVGAIVKSAKSVLVSAEDIARNETAVCPGIITRVLFEF